MKEEGGTNMNIRKRIHIPMIALTIGSCVIMLVSFMILFSKELNATKYSKIDVATMVVENEIDELKNKAQIAAFGMASNPELIKALVNNDRDSIMYITNALRIMAHVDYCTIVDSNGIVLTRTHEPHIYNDSLAHLPHITQAMDGNSKSYVAQGVTIRLGTYAGAPIYDNDMNMIGVVSLGFRLDAQEFVYKLKEITGCEITAFLHDERVSTTLIDEEGIYAIGTTAPEDISEKVLAGESHVGITLLFGNNALTKYIPLYGANDEVVGMMFVGYYTVADDTKILFFTMSGALITLAVLVLCIILARFVSGTIEHKIHETEEYMHLMFDSTPISCTLWNKDMQMINCNREALKLFGITDKERFKNRFFELSPEFQPNGEQSVGSEQVNIKKAFEEGYWRTEWMHQHSNGELLPCEVTLVRVKYKDEYLVAGYTRDLREQKAYIAEIEKTYNTFEKMLQTMEAQILVTEIETEEIIFVNETMKKAFGLTDGIKGKKCWEVFQSGFSERCDFCPKNKPEFNTGAPVYWEENNSVTGKHYRIISRMIDWTNGTKVYLQQRDDVTEAYEREKELIQSRADAEAANRTKSTFLANMSHEIRTPMNSIIGFSELAQDDDIPPKTREYLCNISESAEWLLNIINDILDISKIESGKIVLEHIPFNLCYILDYCKLAIMQKIKEKGIALYIYAEPSIGKKLLGDPIRLRQVLMNLLSNAVKFTNVGMVKLLASIKESDDKSATISFELKDSGIGMSPVQISNIFEPFMQADDSVTRRFGGTGLGLPITKNIVEMMGGVLSVESTPGVGTKFSFDLIFDLIDDVADIPSQKIIFNDFEKPNFNGEILICEDNSLNQQVICGQLARVGLKTVLAHNGQEGVDIVMKRMQNGEKPFDLIFMDIHMPVMDGLEAASIITELGVKTPIIALTANIMSNDLELYKNNGMPDYLGKPFTSQELWKRLIKYLSVVSFSAVDRHQQSTEEDKSLKQLRVYFIKNNKTTITKIIQAADAGDIKLAHRLTHTLKSNAGQIGEKRLQEIAAETETMFSEGKNRLSEEQASILEAELKMVLERLAPLLIEAEANSRIEIIDAEKSLEIIGKLEPMLIKRKPECMNLINDIRTIPGAEKLVQYVEDFEFKRAIDELAKLKKGLMQNNE